MFQYALIVKQILRSLSFVFFFCMQAYTIACADSIAAFTAKKAERLSPEASLDEGAKVCNERLGR